MTITNSEVQSEVPSSNETSSSDTSYTYNTSKSFAITEENHQRRQVIESDNYLSVSDDDGSLLSKREVLIITVTTISAVILIVIAAVVIIIKVLSIIDLKKYHGFQSGSFSEVA